jgi:glyoxylase-like metal-dependent hydrolase (beta-lactamase superfamily II)
MNELSRRGLLGAAAATALAPLTASWPAQAAAPLAGKQASGFYRYKVGSFEVTAVFDGLRTIPLPDNHVRGISKQEVSDALGAVYFDKDNASTPITPAVVNTGSKLVVIDTGIGPAMLATTKGAFGNHQSNLEAAGIDRNNVDVVIISHFHGDHINGLLTADGKLSYPNAEIMVPAAEWKFWTDESNSTRSPEGQRPNFANIKRVFTALGNKVTQYEAGKEIIPGFTAMATYGHTPGHTSTLVSSGSATLLIQADVTAGTALLFVRNPGWHGPDFDGPMAEATRRKLYDQVVADKLLVQGYHFPFPAVGNIDKDGGGYRFVPAMWSPSI